MQFEVETKIIEYSEGVYSALNMANNPLNQYF